MVNMGLKMSVLPVITARGKYLNLKLVKNHKTNDRFSPFSPCSLPLKPILNSINNFCETLLSSIKNDFISAAISEETIWGKCGVVQSILYLVLLLQFSK